MSEWDCGVAFPTFFFFIFSLMRVIWPPVSLSLTVCHSNCRSICLSVYLSVGLSVCRSVCLSVSVCCWFDIMVQHHAGRFLFPNQLIMINGGNRLLFTNGTFYYLFFSYSINFDWFRIDSSFFLTYEIVKLIRYFWIN